MRKAGKRTPIMVSSSIQAEHDNPYGTSKAQAEQALVEYSSETAADYYIYRFPNVFGKWCRPNYNSFVATFCHNIVNDIEITIDNPEAPVTLVYIDDVCAELVSLLSSKKETGLNFVKPEYPTTVGDVAKQLRAFKASRENLVTENVGTGLTRTLYSTYLSYFSPSQFSYTVPSYGDERGVFCEMLKTKESGQFSFFTAHPGITRGGHYHHSKNEKFLVIKGKALFKFEQIITGERYELVVDAIRPEIVETVPGWSHDVTNVGCDELVVMLWANEIFDREAPDTIAKPL
ncbi:NAD-dependent epimerase/dehydratase family protein [Psychromonas sp. MME1]|uniref:polysaccharide biosynthesis C-terminal domain-containing protein n=1 Tax=Psychromonas sp. MME1 TaxID=3231032 RepID=UPI0034E23199